MTTCADTPLLQLVSDPQMRVALEAYARRRGLREEAEDVVQAALCAAVAASNVPSDAEALPRWIHGILRRKVADVFRLRRRWPEAQLPEVEAPPRAFEAREVLRRIDAEVVESRQRHALGWMLREHAGESLLEIARQEAVSPENLRQRICRLRRHLRAQYVVPLMVLLALGASTWSELSTDTTQAPLMAAAARPFAGRWRIERVSGGDEALSGIIVELRPEGVAVRTPEGVQFKHFDLLQVGDDLYLAAGEKRWRVEFQRLSADRVRVTSEKGSAALQRLP